MPRKIRKRQYRRVRAPSRSGRVISGAIGYFVFLLIVAHFLTHREPWDTGDLVRAAFGIIGLQVGVGKSPIEMLDAVTRLATAIRSGRDPRTGRFRTVKKS